MKSDQNTKRDVLAAFAGYPPILTADQVADLLALSSPEIRRLTREGSLPGRRIGKSYRYFRNDIIQWLDSRPSGASD